MSKKVNTSSLTEAAMVCGILVIFSVLSRYFFSLIDFLFPIPIILFGVRRDMKYATLSAVAASILSLIIIGIDAGYMYLVFYTPLALVMLYLIRKDKKPSVVILGGTISVIVAIIIMIYVFQLFTGFNFADELTTTISSYFDEYNKELNTILAGSDSYKDTLQQITELSNVLKLYVNMIVPACFILIALALSYIWYAISYLLGKRLKIQLKPISDISMFRLPMSYVVGTFIMLILSFLLSAVEFSNADAIQANLTILISTSYIIQGLGIIKFVMMRARAKRFVIFIVFILIFILPFTWSLVAILGFMDMIMDFRRIRNKK